MQSVILFLIDRPFAADTWSAYGHTQTHCLKLNLTNKLRSHFTTLDATDV